MKKLFLLSSLLFALTACKTEIEKDVSLKLLLNEPINTQTAILNVQIASCHNHDDSRKPSEDLLKTQQKIPTVFTNAKYKECFSKQFDSFASFEIPIDIGRFDSQSKFKNDVSIYSYKNRQLNVRTSPQLTKNINDFIESEFITNLDFNILITLKNDTKESHSFNVYSAYIDDEPIAIDYLTLEPNTEIKIRLSNASADSLWIYEDGGEVIVLSTAFDLNKILDELDNTSK
ncbi:putative lipoprotein [Pasteurella canis]|uniref:Putative lipoprotein n=1 Tax=Pasteurella canis TaxID=753 RepID=A0A379ETP5_9PAST|nr:hypothetical protein [Pasteurella canis]SUC09757.1 putative lipoprotein [Pasteurella canis]